jgi:hypothetical protein
MITVLLESPLAGWVERNMAYARNCMLDCLRRGEAPFASHLLYTQVLDDCEPSDREIGILAGLALGARLEKSVVYTDLGVSRGMRRGIEDAHCKGRPVEFRTLEGWR